jgi:hypothetical protein
VAWVVASAALLSGCNVVIQNPADQSTITTPTVAANVGLPYWFQPGTFAARLDDRDITSQFMVNAPNGTASATLTVMPGQHMLDVEACWKLNILFVQQPPWPMQGCSNASAMFTFIQPQLSLGPPGLRVPVSQPAMPTVQVNLASSGPLTVTLTSSAPLSAPNSVMVPANSTMPVNIPVQGLAPGSATLSASAPGYAGASLSVAVPPFLAQLAPATGPSGTVVTITGAGFVAPATVQFGTSAPIAVTPASSAQLSVTVPAGLPAAATPVTVTSNMQTSASLNFAVTAAPPSNVTALFRATNDRVEVIRFTLNPTFSSSTFQLLSFAPTPNSPGMLSVGLCRDGARLAWAGAANVRLFTIGGTAATPTLTAGAGTPLPSALTGVGTSCVFLPTVLVRGTDTGVDNLNPATNPLMKLGGFSGAGSSVGMNLAASMTRVWRSYAMGLEEYDMSTPATPNRVANVTTNMTGSSTGTALAWLTPGTTLVRATNLGIDVIGVGGGMPPARLGFNNTGGGSALGVGVSVLGTRAVRGTSTGIEVYDVTPPGMPVRCAFRNTGGGSGTGVGVVAVGTVAFRATDTGIEAYDISAALTSCPSPPSGIIIPAPVQLQNVLALSATGVALVGP